MNYLDPVKKLVESGTITAQRELAELVPLLLEVAEAAQGEDELLRDMEQHVGYHTGCDGNPETCPVLGGFVQQENDLRRSLRQALDNLRQHLQEEGKS